MGKTKKGFIDRKNAVTFHLVHRSQHDPLVTDENAPQHVLVETGKQGGTKKSDPSKRKEEQKKYGVYFDDEYDYLQHLKQPGKDEIIWECVETPNQQKRKNKATIQLPSSVFESNFEEEVGMLNKAAPRPGPRPDLDPDIVAALDDDFDFENPNNELEDDFFVKAMEEGDGDEYDENEENEDSFSSNGCLSDDENDELMDELGELMDRKRTFSEEETKSRFTEYSMSSSVIRRNEQLTLLDDRFEQFYKTYDDEDIGPLDMEDIDGHLGHKHPLMKQCIAEFKKKKEINNYKKEWDEERLKKYREEHSSDEEFVQLEVEDGKQKKWDCESILSTYSNIYNHPKLIEERPRQNKITIDPKTGIPMNVFKGTDDKLTTKALAKFDIENKGISEGLTSPKSLCDKSVLSTLTVLSIRPKDESHEEKLQRKRLLREYRMERRMERKANSEAFKEEKKKQTKIKINNQNNIQGNRIL